MDNDSNNEKTCFINKLFYDAIAMLVVYLILKYFLSKIYYIENHQKEDINHKLDKSGPKIVKNEGEYCYE